MEEAVVVTSVLNGLYAGWFIVSAVVFVNYLRSIGDVLFLGLGATDRVKGPEPAFRQYFFRHAFLDFLEVFRRTHENNLQIRRWMSSRVPDGVFFAVAAVALIPAALIYVSFGLIHLLLVVLLCGTAVLNAVMFRSVEFIASVWRRAFLRCPNGPCYKKIALPIYICPNCNARHKNLVPGSYGVLSRRCKCGVALPTSFLRGRNRKLESICPKCSQPLNRVIGTEPSLHIPIIGGPSTGKTSFLMATLLELQSRSHNGSLSVEIPDTTQRRIFEAGKDRFATGHTLDKTAELYPDAFLIKLSNAKKDSKLVYIYDSRGELFRQPDSMRGHEYYSYLDGLIFLIDPFSLPKIKADLGPRFPDISKQVAPCDERPQDVYDRILRTLRDFKKDPDFGSRPFAVVVCKTDAFQTARIQHSPASWIDSDTSAIVSGKIRQWLIDQSEGNLVRSIEHDFKSVRYFCCSALGRSSDTSGGPFVPRGVFAPTRWLLAENGLELLSSEKAAAG